METIRKSLTPRAVYLLNMYGRLRLENPEMALHAGHIAKDGNFSADGNVRLMIFYSAVQELLERGLIELNYTAADDGSSPDAYGLHATEAGLRFIRQTWPRTLGAVK